MLVSFKLHFPVEPYLDLLYKLRLHLTFHSSFIYIVSIHIWEHQYIHTCYTKCVVISDVGMFTDTWGQLVSTTLNHKTCINTSRQVLEKTLFAINAIFTQDNNLSKLKVEGSLQKTNASCSKCKTNLILTYLHRSRRHSSPQSQKR